MVFGMREALNMLFEEGLENVFEHLVQTFGFEVQLILLVQKFNLGTLAQKFSLEIQVRTIAYTIDLQIQLSNVSQKFSLEI